MTGAIRFKFGGPYRAAAVMAARETVLTPTTRPVSNDHDLIEAVKLLSVRWRHAAEQLFEHGWRLSRATSAELSQERLAFLLNCRPPFLRVEQRTYFCRQSLVCPYCYARRIATLYTNVLRRLNLQDEEIQNEFDLTHEVVHASANGRRRTVQLDLSGRQALAAVRLIERRHEFNIPLLDTEECRDAAARKVPLHGERTLNDAFPLRSPQQVAAISARLAAAFAQMVDKRRELIDTVAPLGAVLYTTVEPWDHCWHLEHRQLFVVPQDYSLPADIQTRTEGVIREYDNVNAKAVSLAIRRTFAYPQRLLLGDHSLTAIYLNARNGRRMWASTGTMRGSLQENEAND